MESLLGAGQLLSMKELTGPKAIGHLDADCFYVSAERVRDEFLREKPVGVLGNQGACVIAKRRSEKAGKVTEHYEEARGAVKIGWISFQLTGFRFQY
jgi:impB/mucB/samB family protein